MKKIIIAFVFVICFYAHPAQATFFEEHNEDFIKLGLSHLRGDLFLYKVIVMTQAKERDVDLAVVIETVKDNLTGKMLRRHYPGLHHFKTFFYINKEKNIFIKQKYVMDIDDRALMAEDLGVWYMLKDDIDASRVFRYLKYNQSNLLFITIEECQEKAPDLLRLLTI
ncbi:MAG: hypothetical protein LBO03_05170 [Acidaminococcales bacterium]|jgi:hypothetical protein|nr:hypothetical protein [Acidaminococcales bacterium]